MEQPIETLAPADTISAPPLSTSVSVAVPPRSASVPEASTIAPLVTSIRRPTAASRPRPSRRGLRSTSSIAAAGVCAHKASRASPPTKPSALSSCITAKSIAMRTTARSSRSSETARSTTNERRALSQPRASRRSALGSTSTNTASSSPGRFSPAPTSSGPLSACRIAAETGLPPACPFLATDIH